MIMKRFTNESLKVFFVYFSMSFSQIFPTNRIAFTHYDIFVQFGSELTFFRNGVFTLQWVLGINCSFQRLFLRSMLIFLLVCGIVPVLMYEVQSDTRHRGQ